MSHGRGIRRERPIPVVYHAGYAYGMVHASTRGERIPSAKGTAIRTDGCTMAHVRIGENGSQHPSPGQRTEEANRESPGRRLVRTDANCIPISRVFLARLSEVPRRPRGNRPKNGKTMAVLLADTKKHTACLRRHVKVIEMWECQWKRERDPPPRRKWTMTQQQIIAAVVDGALFGMIECDIRVPSELRAHFAEMQPIFKNATVTRDDIGPFMREYAEENDIMSTPRRMLVGSYHGKKILLATPLLQWYLAHGLVVDRVYQIVEYHLEACFRQFGESVSTARRSGDADPDKAIIADTMKLLGNSAYGKTVTNVDRHRNVAYCTEVGTSACINNKRFRQLDAVTDNAYEITSNKARLTYDLPLHIGFFVYQYAKLRMLQFYYDFVDRYVAGVNNHFIHNRFVTVVHSTSHSSKLIVLTERAVLIVDTSSGPSTSTVRWTPTRRTLRWPATASTTS